MCSQKNFPEFFFPSFYKPLVFIKRDFLYFLTQYICPLHLLAINLHMNFIN